MTKLQQLHTEQGQSPWLDNLRRDWLLDGTLQSWIERGVRGVTSNPTIFQKAMSAGTAYALIVFAPVLGHDHRRDEYCHGGNGDCDPPGRDPG